MGPTWSRRDKGCTCRIRVGRRIVVQGAMSQRTVDSLFRKTEGSVIESAINVTDNQQRYDNPCTGSSEVGPHTGVL